MKHPRVAGLYQDLVRFSGYLFCWIPACAGMTISEANGLVGLNNHFTRVAVKAT
jgi:hypothetical protein